MIQAIRVNRNAIVIADFDRGEEGADLKPHTGRIKAECDQCGALCWITAGREVENYIPADALSHFLADSEMEVPDKFDDVLAFIHGYHRKDSVEKVDLAKAISPVLTLEMIRSTLDLEEKLAEVCKRIRRWNGLPGA